MASKPGNGYAATVKSTKDRLLGPIHPTAQIYIPDPDVPNQFIPIDVVWKRV